jgi:phospholipid/cholesterol/gamma-HCH transport system substrate-binding protein
MNESIPKHSVIVGLFVVIGLTILISGVVLVGNLNKKFETKIRVTALFDDVSGLQKGNFIWYSGVRVGTVKSLLFKGTTMVEVTMDIDEKMQEYIPKDAMVKLGSDAFIGNKILVIYGGTESFPKIEEGDTLKVEKTLSTEEMINTLQVTNENLKSITSDFKILSNKMVNGEGTLGKLLNDETMYENINTAVISLKNASVKTQQMANNLSELTEGMSREGTLANGLATDTLLFKTIKESVQRLQQIEDTALVILSDLKKAANDPDTPIGVLLNDKETGTNIKETTRNLESGSEKLDEDLKAAQQSFLLRKYFKKKEKAMQKDSIK